MHLNCLSTEFLDIWSFFVFEEAFCGKIHSVLAKNCGFKSAVLNCETLVRSEVVGLKSQVKNTFSCSLIQKCCSLQRQRYIY
jgi:hypothetical protein